VIRLIILARKPLSEKSVAENVLEHGTGGINVDGTRIATGDSLEGGAYAKNPTPRAGKDMWTMYRKGDTQCFKRGGAGEFKQPLGRWPSNLILQHKPGCRKIGTLVVGKGDPVIDGEDRIGPVHEGYQRPQASMFSHTVKGLRRTLGQETIDQWECIEGCPIRDLGAQSGTCLSTGPHPSSAKPTSKFRPAQGNYQPQGVLYDDTGTAARYFKQVQGKKK
jgi:hypothetical protein